MHAALLERRQIPNAVMMILTVTKKKSILKEFKKAKKQKTKEASSKSVYIDCNFIAGSCHRPIGVPGMKREEEEINVGCF